MKILLNWIAILVFMVGSAFPAVQSPSKQHIDRYSICHAGMIYSGKEIQPFAFHIILTIVRNWYGAIEYIEIAKSGTYLEHMDPRQLKVFGRWRMNENKEFVDAILKDYLSDFSEDAQDYDRQFENLNQKLRWTTVGGLYRDLDGLIIRIGDFSFESEED